MIADTSFRKATTSTTGFLSDLDWDTFNAKVSSATLGDSTDAVRDWVMAQDFGTGGSTGDTVASFYTHYIKPYAGYSTVRVDTSLDIHGSYKIDSTEVINRSRQWVGSNIDTLYLNMDNIRAGMGSLGGGDMMKADSNVIAGGYVSPTRMFDSLAAVRGDFPAGGGDVSKSDSTVVFYTPTQALAKVNRSDSTTVFATPTQLAGYTTTTTQENDTTYRNILLATKVAKADSATYPGYATLSALAAKATTSSLGSAADMDSVRVPTLDETNTFTQKQVVSDTLVAQHLVARGNDEMLVPSLIIHDEWFNHILELRAGGEMLLDGYNIGIPGGKNSTLLSDSTVGTATYMDSTRVATLDKTQTITGGKEFIGGFTLGRAEVGGGVKGSFTLYDGTTDNGLTISPVTLSDTRVLAIDDASGTIALLDGAQTFTSATWQAGDIDTTYLNMTQLDGQFLEDSDTTSLVAMQWELDNHTHSTYIPYTDTTSSIAKQWELDLKLFASDTSVFKRKADSINTDGYTTRATLRDTAAAIRAAIGGGSGEINTASNITGDGVGLYKEKSTYDLRFKRLKAGSNITITDNTDSVTIASTGGSGGFSGVKVSGGTLISDSAIVKAGDYLTITESGDDTLVFALDTSEVITFGYSSSSGKLVFWGSTDSLAYLSVDASDRPIIGGDTIAFLSDITGGGPGDGSLNEVTAGYGISASVSNDTAYVSIDTTTVSLVKIAPATADLAYWHNTDSLGSITTPLDTIYLDMDKIRAGMHATYIPYTDTTSSVAMQWELDTKSAIGHTHAAYALADISVTLDSSFINTTDTVIVALPQYAVVVDSIGVYQLSNTTADVTYKFIYGTSTRSWTAVKTDAWQVTTATTKSWQSSLDNATLPADGVLGVVVTAVGTKPKMSTIHFKGHR
jgi:hypothetical protein